MTGSDDYPDEMVWHRALDDDDVEDFFAARLDPDHAPQLAWFALSVKAMTRVHPPEPTGELAHLLSGLSTETVSAVPALVAPRRPRRTVRSLAAVSVLRIAEVPHCRSPKFPRCRAGGELGVSVVSG